MFAESEATVQPAQVTLSLVDGSRLVGTTTLTTFSLRSEVLGTIAIPLDKVRSLKFSPNHESLVVAFANGDQLQGSLGTVALELQTLLGMVKVPLEYVMTIEVRSGGLRLVVWDILPWPTDSGGWGGIPAIIKNNDILLQGSPVRSQTSYTLPLTVECEVELEERTANDGGIWFHVVEEQESRDLEPKRFVMLAFGYAHKASRFRTGELQVYRSDGDSHGPLVWGKTPFPFEPGKTYKLRWDIRSDGMKLTIDDQTFDIPNVTVPWEKLQVRIRGWQSTNRWHVRNVTIR